MEVTHKNPAAVALGTLGGRAKSERKTAAVRINAAAGGRATRAWWQSPAGLARRAAMRKPSNAATNAATNDAQMEAI